MQVLVLSVKIDKIEILLRIGVEIVNFEIMTPIVRFYKNS
jgi:hypothetical protein